MKWRKYMKKNIVIFVFLFFLTACGNNYYSKKGSYIIKNGSIYLKNKAVIGKYDYFDGWYSLNFKVNGSYIVNFLCDDNVKVKIYDNYGEEMFDMDKSNNKSIIEKYNGNLNVEFDANESKEGFRLEFIEQ